MAIEDRRYRVLACSAHAEPRIERIAGVDLRDGDDRLLLHVAQRIRRLDG